MKFRFLFFILTLSFGCNFSQSKLSRKEQLADQVTDRTIVLLHHNYDLFPIGTGGGMINEIRMLSISFNYYKSVGIEEARELIVPAVTTFLNEINSNEEIRSYLKNYPFEAKNIEVVIFICEPDGRNVRPDQLSAITARNGIVSYKIDNPESKLFTVVHQETYEEALQILEPISLLGF